MEEEGTPRKGRDRRWRTAGRWREGEAPEMAEEAAWRCWKHYSPPRYGVCPACLRDRLLRLCPDCGKVRPCACFQSSSSSSSPSNLNSARSGGGCGGGAGIGEMGPMSRLIESELSFRRSGSVGLPLLRSASAASASSHVCDMAEAAAAARPPPQRGSGGRALASLWPRKRERSPAEAKLYRSRSVAAWRGGEEGRKKGVWSWRIPSPMKAFRQLMSAAAKAAGERSRL